MKLSAVSIAVILCMSCTNSDSAKEDNTVTIRHRDSMEQERVPIEKLTEIVLAAI